MSLAKDYAEAVADTLRLRPRLFISRSLSAHVDGTGALVIQTNAAGRVPSNDALDFAAYVFEVLGEGPPPSSEDDVPF